MTNSTNLIKIDIDNFLPILGIIAMLLICYLNYYCFKKSYSHSVNNITPNSSNTTSNNSLDESFISNKKEDSTIHHDNNDDYDDDLPCYNDVVSN